MLTDAFGRRIEYLRLSVTDRCDLRCTYCIPRGFDGFSEPEDWLTFDEIERLVRAFARLGVRRVRLTGGEPLTRRKLPELAARLAAIDGIEDLPLSTNGVQLERHAAALHAAGVRRLNVSLDTLDAARFRELTGGGHLDKVLRGLAAADAAGFTPIRLNMVLLDGVNDGEVEDMVDFCIARGYTLRLIEPMPMGDTGRAAMVRFVALDRIRARLARRYPLLDTVLPGGGPARYVRIAGTPIGIGFITPLSQHFCATCNRVRLAVDGTLYPCVGQEQSTPLRALLREGIDDAGLDAALDAAIARKPERHHFVEQPERVGRTMGATGG